MTSKYDGELEINFCGKVIIDTGRAREKITEWRKSKGTLENKQDVCQLADDILDAHWRSAQEAVDVIASLEREGKDKRDEILRLDDIILKQQAELSSKETELALRRKEVDDLLQDNINLRSSMQTQALRSAANAGKVEALSQVIVEALKNGK